MDDHVSGCHQSIGSRHCSVSINADIFVAADVNASIQVTVMLNASQHQIYLHRDVGAGKKQRNDKIELSVKLFTIFFGNDLIYLIFHSCN